MSTTIPLVPGHVYHIYNRGNNRQPIFANRENYRFFLLKYLEHINPVAATLAYALLSNHFHFMVQIRKQATQPLTLSDKLRQEQRDAAPADATTEEAIRCVLTPHIVSHQFMRVFTGYAKAFNKQEGRTGHLFEDRFQRKWVDSDRYFTTLVRYIHRNPLAHGFVDEIEDWPWTSYGAAVRGGRTRVARDVVLSWFEDDVDQFVEQHSWSVDESTIADLLFDD